MRRKKEKKNTKERELQRVRNEVFKVIKTIYIEPLALRPPFEFLESSESFGESKDVEQEILETLKLKGDNS